MNIYKGQKNDNEAISNIINYEEFHSSSVKLFYDFLHGIYEHKEVQLVSFLELMIFCNFDDQFEKGIVAIK